MGNVAVCMIFGLIQIIFGCFRLEAHDWFEAGFCAGLMFFAFTLAIIYTIIGVTSKEHKEKKE